MNFEDIMDFERKTRRTGNKRFVNGTLPVGNSIRISLFFMAQKGRVAYSTLSFHGVQVQIFTLSRTQAKIYGKLSQQICNVLGTFHIDEIDAKPICVQYVCVCMILREIMAIQQSQQQQQQQPRSVCASCACEHKCTCIP